MNQEIKQRIEEIKNGIVPEGYKKTDVGIIPKDWHVDSLGNMCLDKGMYGMNAPACAYKEELPVYLRITDIDENGKFIKNNRVCVNNSESDKYCLHENDVLFARTGGTVGKSYFYDKNDGKLVFAGYLIKFTININRILPTIIKSQLNTNRYWHWVKINSMRSGQPGVNSNEYAKYSLIVPKSITEQERIAEILEKWDKAIELQEKLIEKLELQKKGTIKHIIGSAKSKPVKLGTVTKMSSGGTPSTKKPEYYDGDIVWVSVNDITDSGKYLDNSYRKLTDLGINNSSAKLFPKNTVLYAMYASIGECCIAQTECSSSQAILGITTDETKLNFEYLYYYLVCNKDKIRLQGQHGVQANLNKKMVKGFLISLPSLEQQFKAVNALRKIDELISCQKKLLNMLKQQRKSLQQLLLTGIVRV